MKRSMIQGHGEEGWGSRGSRFDRGRAIAPDGRPAAMLAESRRFFFLLSTLFAMFYLFTLRVHCLLFRCLFVLLLLHGVLK